MINLVVKKLCEIIKTIYIVLLTLPRDVGGLLMLGKVKRRLTFIEKNDLTVADIFGDWVRKQPNKPCIRYYDTTWTFQDVNINFFCFINFHAIICKIDVCVCDSRWKTIRTR